MLGDDLARVELIFHLGKEFTPDNRFAQKVVRPQLGEPELFCRLFRGANDNNRDTVGSWVLTDFACCLKAIQAGHDDIHENEVRLVGLGQLDGRHAVVCFHD